MMRRLYGASPIHLLAHVVAFVVAGWALHQILSSGHIVNYVAWFVGAAVLHDLVAFPIYSLIDRVGSHALRAERSPRHRTWLNHVRAPTLISAVLLLVYFPVISGLSGPNYRADTGHPLHGYVRNWLLITAGLYLASALVLAVRSLRARSNNRLSQS